MKTVTVTADELLIVDDGKVTVLNVAGQSIDVSDDAVVSLTGAAAVRPSSSWIGHLVMTERNGA